MSVEKIRSGASDGAAPLIPPLPPANGPHTPMSTRPQPPPARRLIAFRPALPIGEEPSPDGINTTLTIPATTALGITMPVPIIVPTDTLGALRGDGFTHFGAHAGHIVTARPEARRRVRRVHHIITGAPDTYRCLYRNGDAANLSRTNLGFVTSGGYAWWLIPRDGENDPAWNAEGLLMRHPQAITAARPVVVPPRPAYTPTPHRAVGRPEREEWWKRSSPDATSSPA